MEVENLILLTAKVLIGSSESSSINEVIRAVLNFLFFFHDKISQVQKSTKHH